MTNPTRNFRVMCTNEHGRTYFSGPRWTEFVDSYNMQPGERCTFYLNDGDVSTYFNYTSGNADGSESEDPDPRGDEDINSAINPSENVGSCSYSQVVSNKLDDKDGDSNLQFDRDL